jgi:hypothetical protein
MAELAAEKRFAVLCQIARAQHFAWREAVAQLCPGIDARAVAERMWEITGRDTAQAYLRRIDPARPLPRQVAEAVAWSSRCMGEDAAAEDGASDREAFVRHRACPWLDWHRKLGLEAEDRPGCDAWFRATVVELNRVLGADLAVETLETLPEGGGSCLRRLWTE